MQVKNRRPPNGICEFTEKNSRMLDEILKIGGQMLNYHILLLEFNSHLHFLL